MRLAVLCSTCAGSCAPTVHGARTVACSVACAMHEGYRPGSSSLSMPVHAPPPSPTPPATTDTTAVCCTTPATDTGQVVRPCPCQHRLHPGHRQRRHPAHTIDAARTVATACMRESVVATHRHLRYARPRGVHDAHGGLDEARRPPPPPAPSPTPQRCPCPCCAHRHRRHHHHHSGATGHPRRRYPGHDLHPPPAPTTPCAPTPPLAHMSLLHQQPAHAAAPRHRHRADTPATRRCMCACRSLGARRSLHHRQHRHHSGVLACAFTTTGTRATTAVSLSTAPACTTARVTDNPPSTPRAP